MTSDTRVLVERVIEEIWNQGDLDVADALFTSNYVNHGGLITDLVLGPEAIKVSVAILRTAFPGLYIVADDVAEEDTAVVVYWSAYRRPPLTNGRLKKTGRLRGVTRCRIERNQIAESWTVWDSRIGPDRLGTMTPTRGLFAMSR
jgi:hypothetical protein